MSDLLTGLGQQQSFLQRITGFVRNWGGGPIKRTPATEDLYRLRDRLMNSGLPQDAAGVVALEIFKLQQQTAVHEAAYLSLMDRVAAIEKPRNTRR